MMMRIGWILVAGFPHVYAQSKTFGSSSTAVEELDVCHSIWMFNAGAEKDFGLFADESESLVDNCMFTDFLEATLGKYFHELLRRNAGYIPLSVESFVEEAPDAMNKAEIEWTNVCLRLRTALLIETFLYRVPEFEAAQLLHEFDYDPRHPYPSVRKDLTDKGIDWDLWNMNLVSFQLAHKRLPDGRCRTLASKGLRTVVNKFNEDGTKIVELEDTLYFRAKDGVFFGAPQGPLKPQIPSGLNLHERLREREGRRRRTRWEPPGPSPLAKFSLNASDLEARERLNDEQAPHANQSSVQKRKRSSSTSEEKIADSNSQRRNSSTLSNEEKPLDGESRRKTKATKSTVAEQKTGHAGSHSQKVAQRRGSAGELSPERRFKEATSQEAPKYTILYEEKL